MSTVALLCSVVGGRTGEAFGGDRTRSSGDMLTDRQTDRQTDRHAHHNTPPAAILQRVE